MSADNLEALDGSALAGDTARIEQLETEVANLRDGLESRTQIGIAIGILASHYRCTSEQAWAVLTRVSSHTNLKVREIGRLVTAVIDGTVGAEDAEALAQIAPHLPHLTSSRSTSEADGAGA